MLFWGCRIDIPTTEPKSFRAGETVVWTKALADFPANGGWTLAYRLIGAAANITTITVITDPLDATGFKATLTAANSALVAAGNYQLVGMATHATQGTFQASAINVTVLPAFTSQYDPRSSTKISLDSVEAAIAAFSAGGIQEYSISVGGMSRSVRKADMSELFPLRDRLKAEYAREQQAAEFARTGINTSRVGVRFARI